MVLHAVLNQVLRAEDSSKVERTTEEYMGDAETMGRPAGLKATRVAFATHLLCISLSPESNFFISFSVAL